jgi:hypothetical protein
MRMTVDPKWFTVYDDLRTGDFVHYTSKCYGDGSGIVALVWLGIEEMCDIKVENGAVVTLCRDLGDKIEVAESIGKTDA